MSCGLANNNGNDYRTNNLKAVLLICPIDGRESNCEPQLLVSIHFKPSINVKSQDNLLILDKTYEPSNRQNFETLSPYIIVVSRSEPIIIHPLLFSKYTDSTNICKPLIFNGYSWNTTGKFTLSNTNLYQEIKSTTRKRKINEQYFVNTTIYNQQLKHILSNAAQNNRNTRLYSVYKLSAPFPYLKAKIRIYKKRKKTWWMILPSIAMI
ncbi:uncharacterized protein LOC111600854 [Drosophila hydei]|uniref:Uncharacterized protein LOC111600854 n=1 Tax=Drosophila hydei TaxID=7224 RepID=A0A6J1LZQ1_DROHY|nr:uncharacterized protein LOC111600854 [Drosophila hydei]